MIDRPDSEILFDRLWPPLTSPKASSWLANLLRLACLALAGSALIAVSSKIQVPMVPVPMTMQTLVILVIGMAGGWRLGGLTVLLFLAEGAVGLPVFAGTPEKGLLIGNVVIYIPGLLWLGKVAGWENPILQWGFTPFIVGDLVKLALAALLLPGVWRLIRKI